MAKPDTHKAAVFILLQKQGAVAMMERTGTDFMNGYYTPASGKVEKNETFMLAAIRELQEELGVSAKAEDLKMVHINYTHLFHDDDWAYCYFVCDRWEGEPVSMEVDKHGPVTWFPLDDLPEKTLPFVLHAVKAWQSGDIYSEFVQQ